MNKLFPLLAVLSLAFHATPTRAAFINGQNYVAISDWARGNGFYGFTRNRGDEIVLTNRTARLVFDVDSAQAEINGVNVRLSFPVAKGALISQLDLDKMVRPLLFPSRYAEPRKITTICLDPGHGGKDTGNRVPGFFWHNEKTYTLELAFELRDQLKQAGFKVILTRNKDTYVDLPARPAVANRNGADLFVSLHFNATQNGKNEVKGPETYCITPIGANSSNEESVEFSSGIGTGPTAANHSEDRSLLLAYQIQKSLVQNLNADDRGVRRARFAVLRDAAMPAILIESGYMTNPTEGKKIYDSTYRKKMAAAIVKGILSYQKLTAPVVSSPVATPNKIPNVR